MFNYSEQYTNLGFQCTHAKISHLVASSANKPSTSCVRTACHKLSTTRVKISHFVASLLTSRQQVVFVLLVPSCQQVRNKLLTDL
jgi:hypothetical protein